MRIVLLLIASIMLVSCDGLSIDELVWQEWGYDSQYTGYTTQSGAVFSDDREDIADGLFDAIQYADKLYNNVYNAMYVNLYDNLSGYNYDNGTCPTHGERTYYTLLIPTYDTTTSLASDVDFDYYCLSDNYSPNTVYTTINTTTDNEAYATEEITINSNLRTSVSTIEYVNAFASIYSLSKYDNFTMTGAFFSDITTNTLITSTDNKTSATVTIAQDINNGSIVNRFDMVIVQTPTFSRTMRFYSSEHGYVDVDLTSYGTKEISEYDIIVMELRDSVTCSFRPSYINTTSFSCETYY